MTIKVTYTAIRLKLICSMFVVEMATSATNVSVSPTTTPMVLVMVVSHFHVLFVVLTPSGFSSFSFSITLN